MTKYGEIGHPGEIGRRLEISELRPKSVVIIRRVDREIYCTVWVEFIEQEFVTFASFKPSGIVTHFLAKRIINKLQDDTGLEIEVYEYLGEI